MASDSLQDRFQKIGAPNTTADVLSRSPIGTPTVPVETARVTEYPIANGQPNSLTPNP